MRAPARHQRPRWVRAAVWAAVALLLAAIFMAYRSPHLVVELANRVWACF